MEQENEKYNFVDKKQYVLTTVFTILTMFTLFTATFILLNERINELETQTSETPVFNQTEIEDDFPKTYTIKERNGKIAIYSSGNFLYELEIYTFTLPEYDKKLLQEGITVSSEQELYDIIASYY